MSEFVPVEGGSDRSAGSRVSMGPSGTIYIPDPTYQEWLAPADAVRLAVDEEGLAVLIEPAEIDPDDPSVYRLSDVQRGGWALRSRVVLDKVEFDLDERQKLSTKWNDSVHGIILTL